MNPVGTGRINGADFLAGPPQIGGTMAQGSAGLP
jgi:hypothetical protein